MPLRADVRKKRTLARSASTPREQESSEEKTSVPRRRGKTISWKLSQSPEDGQTEPEEPELSNAEICEKSGVQQFGLLWKRTCPGKSGVRWSCRFCVVKENFLFYYSEGDAKIFLETHEFNQHPRGVVPLGRSCVAKSSEPSREFCVTIRTYGSEHDLTFDCKSSEEQEQWLSALNAASSLTLENAELGEAMILELEHQGLRLHKEKQQYVGRLNAEIVALQKETERSQSLETIRQRLEDEKQKLEEETKILESKMREIECDLGRTRELKKSLEAEKFDLHCTNQSLQDELQTLTNDKQQILSQLDLKSLEQQKLTHENKNLCDATVKLGEQLRQIESRVEQLTSEKHDVENRLCENLLRAKSLETEKESFHRHSQELMDILQNTTTQKEHLESALKAEMYARRQAEASLHEAETMFSNLQLALMGSGGTYKQLEGYFPDVQSLKDFFEKCAYRSAVDANRSNILKNAVLKQRLAIGGQQTRRNSYCFSGKEALEQLV